MTERLSAALQAALESLARGMTVEQALAPYPDLAPELRPLLEAALAATELGAVQVTGAALARSRSRSLARAAGLRAVSPAPARLGLIPRFAIAGAALLVVLGLGLDGISGAAAQALPGDILYPVKIVSEELQLRLASRQDERLNLEALYSQRRVDEVLGLLTLGRELPLSFHAVVQKMGPTLWNVGGVPVRVGAQTRIVGQILTGMTVEVDGLTQTDGTFLAHELHLESFDTLGPVTSMGPEAWVIGSVPIALDTETWIEPGIQVGDLVLVRVRVLEDGSRVAESILLFAPPTPTPPPAAPPSTAVPQGLKPTKTEEAKETEQPTETEASGEDDGNSGPGGSATQESTEAEATDDEPEGTDQVEEQFTGVVEAVGGSQWVVSGRVVQVTSDTEIRDDPVVGDTVKVVAWLQPDGTWWAEKIERDD